MPVQTVIKLRRDSAADWTSVNPVLAEGEVGLETDTGLVKYGNGTSAWTALPYPSNSNTTYLVRNNTGSTIPKGTLVAATGAEPSGRIDVAPFETTGLQDSELRVMGIATANIASGVNGTVMSFGTLAGLDTRGSTASALAVGDETWAAGDILFAHPTVPGKLTNVRPKHDMAIAFITLRHASAGQIAIRIVPGNFHLEWLHDVELDEPAEGQVLQYDGTDWVNATIDLSTKQDTITGAATTITSSNLTAGRAVVSDGSGKVAVSNVTAAELNVLDGITATTTELNYTDGVTSNIQTQLNSLELKGQSYLFVAGKGSAAQNGAELVAAYNAAKLMTPYGNALSNTNRVSILVGPGVYTPSSKLLVNTNFINILSLDNKRSIVLTNGINVSANNVHIRGIDVGGATFEGCNAAGILIENCSGLGSYSFGGQGTASGTFIDCTGSFWSFGGQGTASGTFVNCDYDGDSWGQFGGQGTASGRFVNCTGGWNSFGDGVTASGTFIDCTAGGSSFGCTGLASGTFINCTGLSGSFGGEFGGVASGTFIDCTAGTTTNVFDGFSAFGGQSASGTFINCTGGVNSFSNGSGTFIDCTGTGPYGHFGGQASGTFNRCSGAEQSFGPTQSASGTFINCTAGPFSFGNDGGVLTGFVLYSRVTSGTFKTPTSGGKVRLSLNGALTQVNLG